jgi:hypothetical protein
MQYRRIPANTSEWVGGRWMPSQLLGRFAPPSASLLAAPSPWRALPPGASTSLLPDATTSMPAHAGAASFPFVPLRSAAALTWTPASGRYAGVEPGGDDRTSREACTRYRLTATRPQEPRSRIPHRAFLCQPSPSHPPLASCQRRVRISPAWPFRLLPRARCRSR